MKFIEEPTICPCCSFKLEKVQDQLFCRNTACEAQVNKKIEHFVKTLGIKGLGPKTIEKLNVQEITELFFLKRDYMVSVLGEKTTDKILEEIERAKSASFEIVLASFSIPLVGQTVASKLSTVVSSFDEITAEKCKQAGLGNKATQNLLDWFSTEYQEIKEFLPFNFSDKPQTVNNNKKVCITGKLKNFKTKKDAEAFISNLGFVAVDSVTKDVCVLIDENNSVSSKVDKAKKYGIPIINDINNLKEYI